MTYRSLAWIVLCAERAVATSTSTSTDDLTGDTDAPTSAPTPLPTAQPTPLPTHAPTSAPSPLPTSVPTPNPTNYPTKAPTPSPTPNPTTGEPTSAPTPVPTYEPTGAPTPAPSTPTPTEVPTPMPTPVEIKSTIKAMLEFDVPDEEVEGYESEEVQSAVAKALKLTFQNPPINLVLPVDIAVSAACATKAGLTDGHCPRKPVYTVPAKPAKKDKKSDAKSDDKSDAKSDDKSDDDDDKSDAKAKTDRRLAANDTYTQMHYDYLIEDLHMALATQAEAAIDLLSTDASVQVDFESNLITLPEFTSKGLSPLQVPTLKSAKRVMLQVPQTLVVDLDPHRCDENEVCYTKMPGSVGRSCKNIADIYMGERSFDMGAWSLNAPAVCGDLCTESYEKGCRAFEIYAAPHEVVYCMLYTKKCDLDLEGDEDAKIRGQYYYSETQPGIMGMKPLHFALGAVGIFMGLAFVILVWKGSKGGKARKGRQDSRAGRYSQLEPENVPGGRDF